MVSKIKESETWVERRGGEGEREEGEREAVGG